MLVSKYYPNLIFEVNLWNNDSFLTLYLPVDIVDEDLANMNRKFELLNLHLEFIVFAQDQLEEHTHLHVNLIILLHILNHLNLIVDTSYLINLLGDIES